MRRRPFPSVPSTGPWLIAVVVFFAAVGLLLVGAAIGETALIIVGAILVAVAGLWGMFFGERAANELSRGPAPGRGRRPLR